MIDPSSLMAVTQLVRLGAQIMDENQAGTLTDEKFDELWVDMNNRLAQANQMWEATKAPEPST